jgi:spore coat polysaccharide biosynthesis protein SpsF
MLRTVAIIQARTGSSRLPGKSLADLLGRPLLEVMLERVRRARSLDAIMVATTTTARDDELASVARGCGALVFRGSEIDVLGRYVGAAALARADVVVRLTAVIDHVVGEYRACPEPVDLVSNGPPQQRTYPDGMDVEVFATTALARLDQLAKDPQDREHVTSRFYRQPFRTRIVDLVPPAGEVRVTVDDRNDLERVRALYADLYPRRPDFSLADVLNWRAG